MNRNVCNQIWGENVLCNRLQRLCVAIIMHAVCFGWCLILYGCINSVAEWSTCRYADEGYMEGNKLFAYGR